MSSFEFSAMQWVLILIAAVCIGLSKAGFGGVAMLSILIMAQIMPARESTGVILPMLILADIFAVRVFHAHARLALVLRMLPPALAGIICGWWLMPRIPAESFARFIGWLSIALIVLVLIQKQAPNLLKVAAEKRRFAWPLGWMAGLTTMLANAAGPVMTVYLLACKLPKLAFVGTAAWFFFAVNLAKVPFSWGLGLINPGSLWINLMAAPGVIVGIFCGRWLLTKINQNLFEWLLIGFSLIGAIRLVLL